MDCLSEGKIWPLAFSVRMSYSHLDGAYNIIESLGTEGENIRLEHNTNACFFN